MRRASVEPPASMVAQVWPDVDMWLERFDRSIRDGSGFGGGGIDRPDMAAQGFLTLLKELRVVFLQDAAV